MSTVLAVESILRLTSPTTAEFCANVPTPVNVNKSPLRGLVAWKSTKLLRVKLLRLTTSVGFTGSATLIILKLPRSISAFMANCPSRAIYPPLNAGIRLPNGTTAPV